MNCFSGCHDRMHAELPPLATLRRLAFFLLIAPVMACGGPSSEPAEDDSPCLLYTSDAADEVVPVYSSGGAGA